MDRKGFTLAELLAVIVILSLLALITVTSITKLVDDSNEELSNTQIELIESAAKVWGSENLMKLPSSGECGYITLGDLKKYGLMDSSVIDAKTNKQLSDDIKIKISVTENEYKKLVKIYEVNPESISGCLDISKICVATTTSNKTTGNVPQGKYIPGDEYICEVGPGIKYTFFVLSTDKDNVNLIMDSNIAIDGTEIKSDAIVEKLEEAGIQWHTAWITKEDFGNGDCTYKLCADATKGPLSALKYLNEATSDWTNLPSLNETYIDEGGNYGEIHLTGKARLPKYSELVDPGIGESPINFDQNYTADTLKNYYPAWLINYQEGSPNTVVSYFDAIWLLSSADIEEDTFKDNTQINKHNFAMDLSPSGSKGSTRVESDNAFKAKINAPTDRYLAGIRPVITFKRSQMPK